MTNIVNHNKVHQKFTSNIEKKVSCSYQNLSNTWQIVKISKLPDRCWEKAVLPGQRIFFKESIEAKLKVFSAENINTVLTDTIPCYKLIAN